jgi:hypothetical protein
MGSSMVRSVEAKVALIFVYNFVGSAIVVRCGYCRWRKFDSSAFFGLLVDMSALISCFESFRCHRFLYSEICGVLVGTTLEVCFN